MPSSIPINNAATIAHINQSLSIFSRASFFHCESNMLEKLILTVEKFTYIDKDIIAFDTCFFLEIGLIARE
jgi:hypothetical protein